MANPVLQIPFKSAISWQNSDLGGTLPTKHGSLFRAVRKPVIG